MDDLIKRQDAIDAVNSERVKEDGMHLWRYTRNETLNEVVKLLKDVPSAFGIGHWVEIGDEPYYEWECDVCGFTIDGSGCIDPYAYRDIYRFCPHCGCRMVSEEEKDYERAIEDVQYNALYEPTYNQEDGSM